MKKIILVLMFIPVFMCHGQDFPFSLDLKKDLIIGGVGVGLAAGQLVSYSLSDEKSAMKHGLDRFHKSDVFFLDRAMMQPYSKGLDITGDILMCTMLAAPVCLAWRQDLSDIITLGAMYAETLLIANGLKEIMKVNVDRYRPYCYYDDTRHSLLKEKDASRSFFSGHSTMAFASAAFISTAYWNMYPDGNSKYWITGGSFAMAAATGAFRIASGCHFFTDVLTGAAVGTLTGWLVPYLHLNRADDMDLAFISDSGKPGLVFNLRR